MSGKNGTVLLNNTPTIGNNTNAARIVDVDLDDPDHILMELYNQVVHTQEDYNTRFEKEKEAVFRLDLFKVDVHSGRGQVLQSGDIDTTTWMTDGHGRIVARIDQSEKPLVDHLIVYNDGSGSEAGQFAATGDNGTGLVGLTEDGKALVQMQSNDQSFYGLVRRELASNSLTPLFFTPNYDVASPIVDEWTGHVIGASFIADSEEDH